MAFDTAANIISDAAIQLGLVSTAIADPYAETDANILRLNACLKQLGQDLARDHQWSHLTAEFTFNTANGTADYALDGDDDFIAIVNGTAWNRTQDRRLVGPLSPGRWQAVKGAGVSPAVSQYFRIWQNRLHIFPTPTAIEAIYYEMKSDLWVAATASPTHATKNAPTLASDVIWFDRRLMAWGLRLYHKRDNGFPSEVEQRAFDGALAVSLGDDGGAPVLDLNNSMSDPDLFLAPETGFGS